MIDADPKIAVRAQLRAELTALLLRDDRFRERFVGVLAGTSQARAAFAHDLRVSIAQVLLAASPGEDVSSYASILAEAESIAETAMDDLTKSVGASGALR